MEKFKRTSNKDCLVSKLDFQYWLQLQADLLDHLKPAKPHWTRLFELNRLLFEFGHLDEYKTMGNKVVTRETEED